MAYELSKVLRHLLVLVSSRQDHALVDLLPKIVDGLLIFGAMVRLFAAVVKDILVYSASILPFLLFWLLLTCMLLFTSAGLYSYFFEVVKTVTTQDTSGVTHFSYLLQHFYVLFIVNCV